MKILWILGELKKAGVKFISPNPDAMGGGWTELSPEELEEYYLNWQSCNIQTFLKTTRGRPIE